MVMSLSRALLALCLSVTSAGLLAAQPARAASSARFHFNHVEGLPDVDCRAPLSPSGHPLCAKIDFPITVFLLPNRDGELRGCASAMPYNQLTVHTSLQGKAVVVTWVLRQPKVRFKATGIKIDVPKDAPYIPEHLFDASGTLTVNDTRAQVMVREGAAYNKVFLHLPIVEWERAVGDWVECIGIDPIIINQLD